MTTPRMRCGRVRQAVVRKETHASATSSMAANRFPLSSAWMNVRPKPPEPRTFGASTLIPSLSRRERSRCNPAGPGLPDRRAGTPAPPALPAGGRYSHAFRLNPSRAVIVSGAVPAENPGTTGPRLGSRSIRSHWRERGSTSSTVRGIDGPSTVIATIEPPALMDSSLATRPGSGIGSLSVSSAYSRICNSLRPCRFHSSATVDRSSLTANSSRSQSGRSATT